MAVAPSDEIKASDLDAKPIEMRNWAILGAFVVNTVMTYSVILFEWLPLSATDVADKYKVVIQPAAAAFSIWGIIFVLEFMFVIAQLTPRFRDHRVVEVVTPWWVAANLCQFVWTPINSLDFQLAGAVLIWGLCLFLVGAVVKTAAVAEVSCLEDFVLLSGIGVHCGWIICASWLSVSIVSITFGMQEGGQLVVAIISLVMILLEGAAMVFALRRPCFLIPLVAAWAAFFINVELQDPVILKDTTREFYVPWDDRVLSALQTTALFVCLAGLLLAAAGVVLRVLRARADPAAPADGGAPEEKASELMREQSQPIQMALGA